MIFMLLEARHNYNSNDAFNALDPDRHSTAMNSILASLFLAHAKLGSECLLICVVLAVQQPPGERKICQFILLCQEAIQWALNKAIY